MNSKQRRTKKREAKFWIDILGEIADSIESGEQTPDQVAKEIREIQSLYEGSAELKQASKALKGA